MIKFFENYKKLKETRLKYQRLQHLLGKVISVKNGIELYGLEMEIYRDRSIHYNDVKKLMRLCDIKRSEIRSIGK